MFKYRMLMDCVTWIYVHRDASNFLVPKRKVFTKLLSAEAAFFFYEIIIENWITRLGLIYHNTATNLAYVSSINLWHGCLFQNNIFISYPNKAMIKKISGRIKIHV